MALLINGGAAISVLAFIGTLPLDKKAVVAGGLVWFAWGAAAAVFAMGLAFAANYCLAGEVASKKPSPQHPFYEGTRTSKIYRVLSKIFQATCMIFGATSLILFVCGMFAVKNSITHLT